MNASAERGRFRKKPRPARCVKLRWHPPSVEAIGAETKNIGFEGAFILGTSQARAGATLTIHVAPPSGPVIELAAIVRWVVPVDTKDHEAGMGVEFVNVDEKIRAALAACFAALPES